MNYHLTHIVASALAEATPAEAGFKLDIWKYVVIIGVVAAIVIYAIKRLGDAVSAHRTARIIDEVVGQGESAKGASWIDDDDDHDGDDDHDDDDLDSDTEDDNDTDKTSSESSNADTAAQSDDDEK